MLADIDMDMTLADGATVRVGDGVVSPVVIGVRPRMGLLSTPSTRVSTLEGDENGVCSFVGDVVGVVPRTVDGEAGDSGRRNGDDLGEP